MKILDYVGIEHGVYIDELIVSKLYDINEYENQFENIINVFSNNQINKLCSMACRSL